MKLGSLDDLFVQELLDLYGAEQQQLRALPRLAKGVVSDALRDALRAHLDETREHLDRLDQIFARLDVRPRGAACPTMANLLAEAEALLEQDADPYVLDAALTCVVQRAEHYEIAGYGCARTFAALLGHDEAARLLDETREEERATDARLTELAEERMNVLAVDE